MDAITMLKTDHDKVKGLLTELESTTERGVKTREELFATIKGELTVHEIDRGRDLLPRPEVRIPRPRTSSSRGTRSTTSSTC